MKPHAILLGLALSVTASTASDWPQFRGPGGSGLAPGSGAEPPAEYDSSSIAWKLALPGRGLASPIVVGDRAFVTCASGPDQKRLHVYCIGADDGGIIWERRFWATGRTMTHRKTNVAAPTPCSDGRRIFALFSSNDLVCLDRDGNVLWLRGLTYDYPNASNSLGLASSPVVVDETLVVQSENDSQSFAAGIDVVTGKNRWIKDRPKAANWTSPVVVPGDPVVVGLQSRSGLLGLVPSTGSEVWEYTGGASTIPSSVTADGVIYVPSHGITALRPPSDGSQPKQLWRNAQISPGTGSPLVVGDRLFTLNKGGVLTATDRHTGERLWRMRTTGPHSASPVAAGTRLYLFNETGLGEIVDVAGEGEGAVISQIDLGETILCTPAVANGALYVRSDGFLWKLDS